jgi:hypothetical protein
LRGNPAPGSAEYDRRRHAPVVYLPIEQELANGFPDEQAINEALRAHLRRHRASA